MSEKQVRVNLTITPGMYESIERYADVMGIRVTEAARHLMIRGLEQVQALRTSADSAAALRAMTEVFEAEMDREEQREKEKIKAKKTRAKADRVPVTPDLRPENRTAVKSRSTVKDIFND